MIEIFLLGAAGLLFGIVAGVLPGLGTGSLIGIAFFALMHADPVSVIVFYIGILMSAQYFGSVAGILTGVPGDPAAIPSATYGFAAAKLGQGPRLIFLTAKYSLIFALISFLALVAVLYFGAYWAQSLSTLFQSGLFLVAVVMIVLLTRDNHISVNVLLAAIGVGLGSIGYSSNYQEYFLVSAESLFKFGVPWMPVLTGLMVIPGLFALHRLSHNTFPTCNAPSDSVDNFWAPATRGGIIGFFLGTVPGLSYILSSIISAKVEEKVTNQPLKIVVSAEAANNSGAVSMLLPLFLLGIPITLSEGIIFTVLTSNTALKSIPELILDNWLIIGGYFIALNLVLFIMAWKLAEPVCKLLFSNSRSLLGAAVFLSIGGTLWLGYYNQELYSYAITLMLAGTVASVVRVDWSVTVFLMIMYPHLETNVYKITQLYF